MIWQVVYEGVSFGRIYPGHIALDDIGKPICSKWYKVIFLACQEDKVHRYRCSR